MYAGLLTQTVTVWPPQSPDGHEVPADSPASLLCRWQDKIERSYDTAGREYVSRAVIYTESMLAVDSFVLRGASELADPIDAGAIRVRSVERSQDPGGGIVVWKMVCG